MSRDEQALNTKNKIVSAATQLFFVKGYEQATMQDIMSATGLSKGALYHHFRSKQEILRYKTKLEQDAVSDFLSSLVEDNALSPKQKFERIFNHVLDSGSMQQLTKARWAEKVPFALLDTLKNTLNVLAIYIEAIIVQGNQCGEFCCNYPKEVAGALLLLIDIWLDPVIVSSDYLGTCEKIDFILLFLEKFNAPLISGEKGEEIKEGIKRHYA